MHIDLAYIVVISLILKWKTVSPFFRKMAKTEYIDGNEYCFCINKIRTHHTHTHIRTHARKHTFQQEEHWWIYKHASEMENLLVSNARVLSNTLLSRARFIVHTAVTATMAALVFVRYRMAACVCVCIIRCDEGSNVKTI